jgi:hypothetical protein
VFTVFLTLVQFPCVKWLTVFFIIIRTLALRDTGTLKQATTDAFHMHAVSWVIAITIFATQRCVISAVDSRWNNQPRKIVERERVLAAPFRWGMKVSTQNPDQACWLKNSYSENVASFKRFIWWREAPVTVLPRASFILTRNFMAFLSHSTWLCWGSTPKIGHELLFSLPSFQQFITTLPQSSHSIRYILFERLWI